MEEERKEALPSLAAEDLSSFIRIFFFTLSTSAEWRVEIASFGRLEDFRKQ